MIKILKIFLFTLALTLFFAPKSNGKAQFVSYKVKAEVISFDAKTITVRHGKNTLRVLRTSIVGLKNRSPISGQKIEIDMFKASPNTEIKILKSK